MRVWTGFLVVGAFWVSFGAYGQATSEDTETLRRVLVRFPQADGDGDGILTQAEGQAFQRARRANRKPPAIIAPAPTHEDVKYGPYDRNVYDLWLPESDSPTGLIIQVHGGGFRGGDKSRIRSQKTVQNTLDAGLAFASINYRFAFTRPEDADDPQKTSIQNVLRDSARALQHIRYHASDYNIDKKRIGMYGGSAGAGTSLFIGFRDDLADADNEDPILRESTRLAAVGMLNGQFSYDLESWDAAFKKKYGADTKSYSEIRGGSDFSGFYGLTPEEYAGPKGQAVRADVDMINHIDADDPPVFAFCSNYSWVPLTVGEIQHDPLHAEVIAWRAREHGLEVECILPNADHHDGHQVDMKGKNASDMLLAFFVRHLE